MLSIHDVEGVLYTKDWKTLLCGGGAFGDYTVASGAEEILAGSFQGNSSVVSVTIPEGVTTIGQGLFFACDNLERVYLPSTVSIFGDSFVGGCPKFEEIVEDENNPYYTSDSEALLFIYRRMH